MKWIWNDLFDFEILDHEFYIAKVGIKQVLVLDYFGGVKNVDLKDYFQDNDQVISKRFFRIIRVFNIL